MNLNQVQTAVENAPKGANIIVEWVRPCKVKKGCADSITKSVRMVGRIGIDYDNLKAVEAKRESGELPAENQGLPWGKWYAFPYLIEHKGTYYLRLYNGTSDKVHADAHFFRNGVEVTKESLDNDLLAAEKSSEHGDTFTCKVENMTRIHTESEWLMLIVGSVGQERIVTQIPVPAKVLATI